jgi:hypothetical protein
MLLEGPGSLAEFEHNAARFLNVTETVAERFTRQQLLAVVQ